MSLTGVVAGVGFLGGLVASLLLSVAENGNERVYDTVSPAATGILLLTGIAVISSTYVQWMRTRRTRMKWHFLLMGVVLLAFSYIHYKSYHRWRVSSCRVKAMHVVEDALQAAELEMPESGRPPGPRFTKLDGLPCPSCRKASAEVRFTHPSQDRYCIWLVCVSCEHEWRVSTLDRPPRVYFEDRIDKRLEGQDAELLGRNPDKAFAPSNL